MPCFGKNIILALKFSVKKKKQQQDFEEKETALKK